MHNSYDRLAQLLCEVPEYAVEGRLNKNIVAELARKYDAGLINKLLSDKDMKKLFFSESDAGLIFKKDIFLQFISQKEFLPDSYTAFEQKIGLASGGTMLRNDDRIVLNWPYKDCILEGGQTKEDAKRDEVFFNEILAPDEINTILEDKVFTNWKRCDKDGEHELDELKPNDNLVIKGNNLVVLHSLKKRFAGKVKLIYIDPPFNTGNDSFKYNDTFNHSTWLTFMKNRLEAAKELLSREGLIFIHIDDGEEAYLKVLADEIFGRENFLNIIAVRSSTPSGTKTAHKDKTIVKQKDLILVYKNGGEVTLNPQYKKRDKWDSHYSLLLEHSSDGEYHFHKLVDVLRDMELLGENEKLEDINLDNEAFKQFYLKNANTICRLQSHKNKEMGEKSKRLKDQICEDYRDGKVHGLYYNGQVVTPLASGIKKVYRNQEFVEDLGVLLCDFWDDIDFQNTQNEGGNRFPTAKKPEMLLYRIIDMCTEPGDIVLDFFLGSGTTAAVSHKMGRQYIGIEQMAYGDDDSISRLRNIVNGDPSGVSNACGWKGGGSFVYCNIKNDANKFREKVQAADDKKMDDLLKEVLNSSFLSYRIDSKNHNIKLGDFHKLSLADKKHVLLDLIDNNTLYLNYSEIDDATYKISDEDKKHNKAFYGE